jgi:hypothetical protein
MSGEEELNEFDEFTFAVQLQIQQFLDEWHYRIIANLSGSWDRPMATHAALSLMELQGVSFEVGEKETLVQIEESTMIQRILAKMPVEFKKSFENWGKQMQAIVTKATEIRKVVDEGNPDVVQGVMDQNDGGGIVSKVLKNSIVQAGVEVAGIRNRHTSWTKNTDSRISRLIRSADDAAAAQRQLNAVQMQLSQFGSQQNEKSKKMMAGVAANNDKGLIVMIFSGWIGFTIKMKSEKDIRDGFEKEIENLDTKLMEYRQAALNNVRNVLMRKAAEGDSALIIQVWKSWADEVQETKKEAGSQDAMKAMEAKLSAHSAAQAENTKKVMARMSSGSGAALCQLCLGAWKEWLEDYKKNKDMEDAVKAQEKQMQEYLAKKKDEAKRVLDSMNASTDSGLCEHVMSTWAQHFKDEGEALKMERLMAENEAKFGALNGRQKDNAKGVMGRVNEQMDLNVLLRNFSFWAIDTKLERIQNHYSGKMESKKEQLKSVQHLFKNFAHQLDQGLKADDSARGSDGRRKRDDGAVTLPDIGKR